MAWWIWLIIGFSLIFFEMFLPSGFALLIIGASFVITGTAVAFGLDNPVWLEWLICLVSFIVLFFSARKPLLSAFGLDAPSQYDELSGQRVKALSRVAPGDFGQGEMQGTQWKIKNVGSESIQAGDSVSVVKIDGLTVEVKK